MSPATCRAGRALLHISQDQLATLSRVSKRAISGFEAGQTELIQANRDTLQRALEAAGVVFIDENGGGPGVRLREPVKD